MRRFVLVVLNILFATSAARAQTLTVTPANSPFVVSVSSTFSQVTIATGGTLVLNAPVAVTGDMVVQSAGRVTLDPGLYTLKLNVAGTLTVDSGGVIEADGKGLQGAPNAGFGLSKGATLDPVTMMVVAGPEESGGSHATPGGNGSFNDPPAAPMYGDWLQARPGGGGGSDWRGIGLGGAGGGVLNITAGSLILNGQFRANGENGIPGAGVAGAGAGGSIDLRLGQFSGAGVLSADGGIVVNSAWGSGGAGRIRATYASWNFSGNFNVRQAGRPAGTVYLFNTALNQLRVAAPTVLGGGESYDSVVFTSTGSLRIAGRVNLATALVIPAGNTVTLSSANALDGLSISSVAGTLNVNAAVSQSGDMVISGLVVLDGHLTVANLDTVPFAVITHSSQFTGMRLTVPGTLRLVAGAQIRAGGMGYLGGRPNGGGMFGFDGATIEPVTGLLVSGSGATNGGSHGGLGGRAAANSPLAPLYDNPASPMYAGGGGGGSMNGGYYDGGNGGGLLRLVAGALVLDGNISADGSPAPFGSGSGGGAGGTVVISVATLSGTGGVYARGGPADSSGGGGGIINLSAGAVTSPVVLSVAGGTGQFPGATGVLVQTLVSSPVRIISVPPTQARVGDQVVYRAAAIGTNPITWSLLTAPAGAQVADTTGQLTWTGEGTGPHMFSLKATNDAGSDTQSFTIDVVSPPAITSTASTTAVVGVPYRYDSDGRAEATGTGPVTWAVWLAPPGFVIDPLAGDVQWTPTGIGTYSACLRASNMVGESQQCFVMTVSPGGLLFDAGAGAPKLVSAPSTTANCGIPYRYSGNRVPEVHGTGPFTFVLGAIPGSSIPDGLRIDAETGEFAWTPTDQDRGVHPLVLTVENAVGQDHQTFSIVVDCPPEKPLKVGCGCSGGGSGLAILLMALFLLPVVRSRRMAQKPGE